MFDVVVCDRILSSHRSMALPYMTSLPDCACKIRVTSILPTTTATTIAHSGCRILCHFLYIRGAFLHFFFFAFTFVNSCRGFAGAFDALKACCLLPLLCYAILFSATLSKRVHYCLLIIIMIIMVKWLEHLYIYTGGASFQTTTPRK